MGIKQVTWRMWEGKDRPKRGYGAEVRATYLSGRWRTTGSASRVGVPLWVENWYPRPYR